MKPGKHSPARFPITAITRFRNPQRAQFWRDGVEVTRDHGDC